MITDEELKKILLDVEETKRKINLTRLKKYLFGLGVFLLIMFSISGVFISILTLLEHELFKQVGEYAIIYIIIVVCLTYGADTNEM